ncbi:MAG: ArsC family reductase [Gammaproteobacteria bacterium]|nr:ArsC family reductase [Gammaproteobacteria bacterium]
MKKITLYGIKNCDTVRKARRWLDDNHIHYDFHDFRADGLTKTKVNQWLKEIDQDILINRRGTTWRKLTDEQKSVNSKSAIADLLVEQPAIIKRPVLDNNGKLYIGFKDAEYKELFGK